MTQMPSTPAYLTRHQLLALKTFKRIHLCASPYMRFVFKIAVSLLAAVSSCTRTHKGHRPRLPHRLPAYDDGLSTQSDRCCVSTAHTSLSSFSSPQSVSDHSGNVHSSTRRKRSSSLSSSLSLRIALFNAYSLSSNQQTQKRTEIIRVHQ